MDHRQEFLVAVILVIIAVAAGRSAPASETVAVTVHTEQRSSQINPFIYGQFIEHLGRCIYGGIWAEMLEDRKFYFPITKDYDPYKSLQDTSFPVVGASPWQIVGDPGNLVMVKEASFVGDHTPRILPGTGIRQRDLALVKGKRYEGYIWLKSLSQDPLPRTPSRGRGFGGGGLGIGSKAEAGPGGPVEVALVWGTDPAERQVQSIEAIAQEYQKHAFAFTAGTTTDVAMLEVRVTGDRPVSVGTLSLMPEDNVRGMRADTLALLKQLNAPIYRWPGGNFVSGYDWRDGIGPRDRRPPRKNPAWTGVEHNDFGIDDFIAYCREVKAEPMIAANTGFGDAYSAAQEVEYCNRSADTVGGALRIANGHAEPYDVKHWCVGNEMFGPWQLGFMQLGHYVQKHDRVVKRMLEADSSVKLVGVGNLGGFNRKHDPDQKVGWTEGMLQACSDSMDYISEHFYRGRTPWAPEKPDIQGHVGLLRDSIREKVEGHRKLQEKLGLLPNSMVPIAMDEWNYWHRKYVYGELGCVYDLADALGVAAGLHEYFRSTDIIQMAHYAQTVNVIGCIKTTKTKAFLSTTALPLMLYRQQFGNTPVAVSGDQAAQGLDVAAALTADGDVLTIGVVNPHGEPRNLQIDVANLKPTDQASLWRIAGDKPTEHNSVDEQPITIDGPHSVAFDGNVTVPPYSVSLYRLPHAARNN